MCGKIDVMQEKASIIIIIIIVERILCEIILYTNGLIFYSFIDVYDKVKS